MLTGIHSGILLRNFKLKHVKKVLLKMNIFFQKTKFNKYTWLIGLPFLLVHAEVLLIDVPGNLKNFYIFDIGERMFINNSRGLITKPRSPESTTMKLYISLFLFPTLNSFRDSNPLEVTFAPLGLHLTE
jgi:hypothetical protein